MSSTYRPGDIAMVTSELDDVRDEPGVFLRLEEVEFWSLVSGKAVWAADADEVGPVLGNVADIARLADGPAPESEDVSSEQRYINLLSNASSVLAERDRLTRWKEEAMPVMDGLQELGKALHIPLGERITGPAALEAVQKLRGAAQAFLDAYDQVGVEVWWPEESDALREVLERG